MVDFFKSITIAFRDHTYVNPMGDAKVDEMIECLRLPPSPHVLDIACGTGIFLARIAERWNASGVGVDIWPWALERARERMASVGAADRMEIVSSGGAEYGAPDASFDLVSCIGASWIFEGHAGTLAAAKRIARPGGAILVGEPFWIRAPSRTHLDAVDFDEDAWGTHLANAKAGEPLGLTLRHSIVSSVDDWDRYEGRQWNATETWANEAPDDPDRAELLERCSRHRDVYLRWGRAEVGWALYLFQKPTA